MHDGSKILPTPGEALAALGELASWSDELHLAYAWISSSGGRAAHWKTMDLDKVTRAVIGIHFAQTEPRALRMLLRRRGTVRVINDTEGVFHPKVIVGIRGEEARAIVGSSNLTNGGFDGNTELNMLLHGSRSSGPLAEIVQFIETQWNGARRVYARQRMAGAL